MAQIPREIAEEIANADKGDIEAHIKSIKKLEEIDFELYLAVRRLYFLLYFFISLYKDDKGWIERLPGFIGNVKR